MKFEDLGLAEPLLRAVRALGYPTTTKIQAAAIPAILEGRDVLGRAQTGTGKTAAFALPTLQRLRRKDCRANGRGRKQGGGGVGRHVRCSKRVCNAANMGAGRSFMKLLF